MEELFELLMEEKKETERVLARISRDLKRLPEGKLEVATARGKYVQYYAVIVENGQRTRKYLAKKDRKIAELLVQRDYEVKLKKVAEERLDTIDHALQVMKKTDLKEIHRRMKPARQALILPLIPTDEQYIEQWYEEHRGATMLYTFEGEAISFDQEELERIIRDQLL